MLGCLFFGSGQCKQGIQLRGIGIDEEVTCDYQLVVIISGSGKGGDSRRTELSSCGGSAR